MAKNALLFSGQGSQYTGMGKEFYENYEICRKIFDIGKNVLGFDLAEVCFNIDESELSKTIYAQPAIFAVSVCGYTILKEKGITFEAVAGHSLGEYAAMVACGIMTIEDGFKAIKIRSEAMQKACETAKGVMYAIIGLDAKEIEQVCEEIDGYVLPVNYNSSVQTVIAGEENAVLKAVEIFTEKKAKAIKLNVASAFHSKLMQGAADEFLQKSSEITFSSPKIDFYTNLTGEILQNDEIVNEYLTKHIVSPVKFTSELKNLQANGFDTFIEVGPNKILSGLVKKTLKGVSICNVENIASLEKAIGILL